MPHGKILAVIFLTFTYLGCQSANDNLANVSVAPRSNSTSSLDSPTQNASTPNTGVTPLTMADDLLITLERGVCYGRCAQYVLTINSDGSVVFNGKEETKVKGKATGSISKEDLKTLIAQFDKVKFFQLDDRYEYGNCPNKISDTPSATTTMRVNGKTKTVRHYLGCVEDDSQHTSLPPGLMELEQMIDRLAGSKRWVEGE
jgi:hypothetical protein